MPSSADLQARLARLDQYVPYGPGYNRAIADEWRTAWRLIREGRAEEAEYFTANAERVAARYKSN